MRNTLTVILAMASVSGTIASTSEPTDTAKVLGEVFVIEKSAKAPIPLLPLDVKVIGSQTIENSTETNMLPLLQNHIPGMFVTERGHSS